jgi:hypothetical protein
VDRLRAAALLAAVGLALSGVAGVAAQDRTPSRTTCADAGAVERLAEWESVRGPRFTLRPLGAGQDIAGYAVHPYEPDRRFATNGTSVERSDDGGCTWREVHVLPPTPSDEDPQSVAGSRIVELVVPEDPRAADRLVLLVQDEGGAPHVLVSEDGGIAPFERRDDGLPARADATDLLVSPSNPEFLFLSVHVAGTAPDEQVPPLPVPLPTPLPGVPPLPLPSEAPTAVSPGALYASVDGGQTWESRIDLSDLGPNTDGIDVLEGDPVSANRLWAVSDGVLLASRDAGRTFDAPGPTPAQQRARGWRVTAVVAASVPSQPARLLAFTATSAQQGGPRLLRSVDGGRMYDEVPAPGPVESAALVGPGRGLLAVSTGGPRPAVQTAPLPLRGDVAFTDRTPVRTNEPFAVATDRSESATIYARTPRALLRYVGAAVAVPPPDAPEIGRAVDGGGPPQLGPAGVTPASVELVLPSGAETAVQHVVMPPQRATPLDLYVLVDTSESMADDLDRLRSDLLALVARLRERGIGLEVGLGEFKGGESSLAYRRVVGVGPDPAVFRTGLSSLVADGFGEEAQLIALEQALAGAGETLADLTPAACKLSPSTPDRFVRNERRTAPPTVPGQAADFRAGAVPVVLMITDTNFLRPVGTPLKPDCTVDVERVAQRYRAAGVFTIGLGLDDVDNPARAADLLTAASITGAFQPPGSTCAPGIADQQPAPAVCRTALDLVPTLERLVAQTTEPAELAVVAAPRSPAIRPAAQVLRGVDLRRPVPQTLPVTYSCVDLEAGSYSGRLAIQLAGRTVADVTAQVTCLPPEPETVPPLRPPAAVAAAPLVGLLPPPVPLPPPAPPGQVVQPQTQPQAQTQTQAQAQTGAQEQERTAAELALALQSAAREEGVDVQAMSAREVPDVVRLTSLALMTAAAGGLAVRRRSALRAVAVRVPLTRR